MAVTLVHSLCWYRHPKTGRKILPSQEKAYRKWFKKRYKRRAVRERWLYTTDAEPAKRKIRGEKYMRLVPGGPLYRIQLQVKMTEVEKILPLSSFTNRHIRETFNNKEVFRKIWDNWGGVIRITVSGVVHDLGIRGGRRVREIIHLGFHKEHWEIQQKGRGKRAVAGRELFRRWLVSSVSSNLRRRGLRLSNPKESQQRITRLRQELFALQGMTEFTKPSQMAGHVAQIKWKADAIRKQKKTKQITGGTIRIEKLV